MLWVIKRTVSMRQFFQAPTIYAKIYLPFYADFFCLSRPLSSYLLQQLEYILANKLTMQTLICVYTVLSKWFSQTDVPQKQGIPESASFIVIRCFITGGTSLHSTSTVLTMA